MHRAARCACSHADALLPPSPPSFPFSASATRFYTPPAPPRAPPPSHRRSWQAFADRFKKAPVAADQPLSSAIGEFYQTDSISRASKTMAKCVRARQQAATA